MVHSFYFLQGPTACVLCAGTSDLPVAEEAAVTLGRYLTFPIYLLFHTSSGSKLTDAQLTELANYRVTRVYDVGVAGIHRLLHNQHILRASDVAICVAGMDGALPGVVVGHTTRQSYSCFMSIVFS